MTSVDLKKYCSKDDDRPVVLHAPWSAGEYTYAANGHIMVRVPRLADVPENPKASKTMGPNLKQRPIDDFFTDEPKAWYPLESPCYACDGTGKHYLHLSVEVGGIPFSDLYLSWIAELPGGEIGPMGEEAPARFRFEGGEGLLMPKRKW